MATSGKSKSQTLPNGKRRVDEEGRRLAPRSIRREKGKTYMEECTDYELKHIAGIPREEQTSQSRW